MKYWVTERIMSLAGNGPIRVIVCGSRGCISDKPIHETLDAVFHEVDRSRLVIIHGGAPGVDLAADRWAFKNGVSRHSFDADWRTHGMKAGPIRNRKMLAEKPCAVIAFAGGKGTANMVGQAEKAGVFVFKVLEEKL